MFRQQGCEFARKPGRVSDSERRASAWGRVAGEGEGKDTWGIWCRAVNCVLVEKGCKSAWFLGRNDDVIWIGRRAMVLGTKFSLGIMRAREVVLELQGREDSLRKRTSELSVCFSTREGALELMEVEGGGKGRGLHEK